MPGPRMSHKPPKHNTTKHAAVTSRITTKGTAGMFSLSQRGEGGMAQNGGIGVRRSGNEHGVL